MGTRKRGIVFLTLIFLICSACIFANASAQANAKTVTNAKASTTYETNGGVKYKRQKIGKKYYAVYSSANNGKKAALPTKVRIHKTGSTKNTKYSVVIKRKNVYFLVTKKASKSNAGRVRYLANASKGKKILPKSFNYKGYKYKVYLKDNLKNEYSIYKKATSKNVGLALLNKQKGSLTDCFKKLGYKYNVVIQNGDFYYLVKKKNKKIVLSAYQYVGDSKVVTLPKDVVVNNKRYTVNSIESNCFKDKAVSKITVKGAINITKDSFTCGSLKQIEFKKAPKSIEDGSIPNGVEIIASPTIKKAIIKEDPTTNDNFKEDVTLEEGDKTCTHNYEPVYKTVTYSEEGHYETVVKDVQKVHGQEMMCYYCGIYACELTGYDCMYSISLLNRDGVDTSSYDYSLTLKESGLLDVIINAGLDPMAAHCGDCGDIITEEKYPGLWNRGFRGHVGTSWGTVNHKFTEKEETTEWVEGGTKTKEVIEKYRCSKCGAEKLPD